MLSMLRVAVIRLTTPVTPCLKQHTNSHAVLLDAEITTQGALCQLLLELGAIKTRWSKVLGFYACTVVKMYASDTYCIPERKR
jgi:hypothetical protein